MLSLKWAQHFSKQFFYWGFFDVGVRERRKLRLSVLSRLKPLFCTYIKHCGLVILKINQ